MSTVDPPVEGPVDGRSARAERTRTAIVDAVLELLSEGDFQRNRNQQAVLQGIISKLISADTLTDPAKLRDTISTIAPYMTTDDGLDSGAMIELGLSLRSIRSGDIHYLAVPNSGPYTTSGGASVVGTDEEAMDLLRTALREDTMSSYYADNVSND